MRSAFIIAAALIISLFGPARATAYEQELRKLSSELTERIAKAQKTTLAVVDFTDLQGNVTFLGRFLAEELSVGLADTGRGFRVIDRIHLASILREHKLSQSGLIDSTTARELGKITGVEAIITGSITPFGDSVRIAVKLLDAESASIIGSARSNIPKTGAIDELLKQGISGHGRSIVPAGTNSAAVVAMSAQQTIVSEEFSFALRGCRASGAKVTCDFIITNQSDDRDLKVYPESRIFDEFGNEYHAIDARIGNSRRNWERPGSSSLSSTLVSGIPTKAEVSFSKIAPQSELLTMLEINCNRVAIQFRNVPVTR